MASANKHLDVRGYVGGVMEDGLTEKELWVERMRLGRVKRHRERRELHGVNPVSGKRMRFCHLCQLAVPVTAAGREAHESECMGVDA